jgi:hypothetical protein
VSHPAGLLCHNAFRLLQFLYTIRVRNYDKKAGIPLGNGSRQNTE